MTALQPTFGTSASRNISAGPQTAGAPDQAVPAISSKTWLAVFGATLGAFMAVLNIQIVNASLADIQGAIGAGIDDGGWISTSYLIAEIVVIPLSGWLAQVFSVRIYLLTNAVLFLVLSVACAFAQNLPQMIVLRALQGFSGGVLIPMAFTLIITLLPKVKQPIGLALFALSATFAPAIGPTIGGYLTENWGWQYIFYVNLAPGALMIGMLWFSLEAKPMKLELLRQGDWPGVITMAIGLAALQTVLEEGNKDDWFGSAFIVRLSIVAAVALALFLWIELTTPKPLLNLRLLARRNFGFGILANFLLGTALYGSVFILPVYLSRIQGYNAEQIGMVLAWTGLPQLILIPMVPRLMKRFDPRLVIGVGFALFAASNFMNIYMTVDYSSDQLFWPNVVRAIGQALVFAPLSAVATSGIEPENASSASGLFNMMRNLGGAVGIAALQTFLTKREQYHSNVLSRSVSLLEQATRDRLEALTQYFVNHGVIDRVDASQRALVAIGHIVQKQAFILAFSSFCSAQHWSWRSWQPCCSANPAVLKAAARTRYPSNQDAKEHNHETPTEFLSSGAGHHQGTRCR
jgi:DHA2 family multidrug resistance protein